MHQYINVASFSSNGRYIYIYLKFKNDTTACIIDIPQRSLNLHHIYPGMQLKLGVFGFFL